MDENVANASLALRPPQPIRLSKSRIAAFEHCPKRLWLEVHRPQLARHEEATIRLFEAGHKVGELARARYAEGVIVAEDHRHVPEALARTNQLITSPGQKPIFEAAFQRGGVVIRTDILEPDGWGGWRLIEVKNSARMKPYQLFDVSTQAWVLRGNSICVSSMIIRHVQRPLLNGSALSPSVRFIDVDVTLDVQQLVPQRQNVVNRARAVAQGSEPKVHPGHHCVRPFRCEFRDHCSAADQQSRSAVAA